MTNRVSESFSLLSSRLCWHSFTSVPKEGREASSPGPVFKVSLILQDLSSLLSTTEGLEPAEWSTSARALNSSEILTAWLCPGAMI